MIPTLRVRYILFFVNVVEKKTLSCQIFIMLFCEFLDPYKGFKALSDASSPPERTSSSSEHEISHFALQKPFWLPRGSVFVSLFRTSKRKLSGTFLSSRFRFFLIAGARIDRRVRFRGGQDSCPAQCRVFLACYNVLLGEDRNSEGGRKF